ncbi:MAG: 30S ribosomal protein S20, partial [Clostridia bacterium]|nr:30S ribosomal protein S20 [Clostridia bacterium]
MPNIKSAKKRVLVSEVRNARNRAIKTAVKTQIKKFDAAVAEGANVEAAYKAVVARSGNGYTVNVTGIGYIGLESGKNSLSTT